MVDDERGAFRRHQSLLGELVNRAAHWRTESRERKIKLSSFIRLDAAFGRVLQRDSVPHRQPHDVHRHPTVLDGLAESHSERNPHAKGLGENREGRGGRPRQFVVVPAMSRAFLVYFACEENIHGNFRFVFAVLHGPDGEHHVLNTEPVWASFRGTR